MTRSFRSRARERARSLPMLVACALLAACKFDLGSIPLADAGVSTDATITPEGDGSEMPTEQDGAGRDEDAAVTNGPDGSAADDAGVAQADAAMPDEPVRPDGTEPRAIGGRGWLLTVGLDVDAQAGQLEKRIRQGMHPVDISGYAIDGVAHYAALWHEGPAPDWRMLHGLTEAQLSAWITSESAAHYRPTVIQGFDVNGTTLYNVITVHDELTRWEARWDRDAADYQAALDTLKADGFYPVHVNSYEREGQPRFAAILVQDPDVAWRANHDLTLSQFQETRAVHEASGMRASVVAPASIEGGLHVSALYLADPKLAVRARHDVRLDTLQEEHFEGFRPEHITVYGKGPDGLFVAVVSRHLTWNDQDLAALEQAAHSTMLADGIPGLSVALARNGRLVYARAFGMANLGDAEPLRVRHRMRIASISKTITATAVMQMITSGDLHLEDRVFGRGGLLGERYATESEFHDARVRDITVQHLLEHGLGGWDADSLDGSLDPVFDQPERSQDELISWLVRTQPLEFAPGARFQYSNVGYVILARIIESVDGKSYAQEMDERVFDPSWAAATPAGQTLASRRDDEAAYHVDARPPRADSLPYQLDLARADGAGGWLATPRELVRIMLRLDGLDGDDVLSPSALSTMTAVSGIAQQAGDDYARGIRRNAFDNWWHEGFLPGTQSFFARIDARNGPTPNDAYVWAAIANGTPEDVHAAHGLDAFMWRFAQSVNRWPTADLVIEPLPL